MVQAAWPWPTVEHRGASNCLPPPCSHSTEISEKGCRLPIQEVPSSHQLPSWPGLPALRPAIVGLWPCHQPPSRPGSRDEAVTRGKRAAAGPQSVTALLNRVLSLSLSLFPPYFASCRLQSLGTLSPYSQVMPPPGTGGSVTCCHHRASLCPGTTGALLNVPPPGCCPDVVGDGGPCPGGFCPSGPRG